MAKNNNKKATGSVNPQGQNDESGINTPPDTISSGTDEINGAQGDSTVNKTTDNQKDTNWIAPNEKITPMLHAKEFNSGTFGRCSTIMVAGPISMFASIDQQVICVAKGLNIMRGTCTAVQVFHELDAALEEFRNQVGR